MPDDLAQKVIKKGLMKRLRNCLEEVPHEKKINCPKASIPKKKRIHGGDESSCSRVLYLEKEVEFFPEKWSEAHALIRIHSERKIRSTAVTSTQTRYYICSTKKSAKEFNEKVRDHVENKLHGSLDVTMNEDGDMG